MIIIKFILISTIARRLTLCYTLIMIDFAKYSGMKICVAVSGGKDSMALLHNLHAHASEYGITLSALNCDHKIRGEASARDSTFVKEWCESNGVPLIFFEWNNFGGTRTESGARSWRLKCYGTAIKAKIRQSEEPFKVYPEGYEWGGADAVVTAHHLNDNAETVLFNLARGCALSGAEGITDCKFPADGNKWLRIIHPLISTAREEIDQYVSKNNVPYVEDETNHTDDYTRNKIRHNVLPELEKAVPGAAKALYRFSRLAADDEQYFDNLIEERKLIKKTRLGCEIANCKEKVVFKRAVIKALVGWDIKDYTSEHAQRLYELQFAEKGKKFEFLGFTAFKEDGRIAICSSSLLYAEEHGIQFKEHLESGAHFYRDIFISISDGVELQENLLAFEAAAEDDERIPAKFKVLKFDCGKIPDGAVIRAMKEGDKFTKFGGGTKNLGDFFTDRKIPVRIRKQIPLIADGSEILAVGGVEISDKIKITENTEKALFLICADYAALYRGGEEK